MLGRSAGIATRSAPRRQRVQQRHFGVVLVFAVGLTLRIWGWPNTPAGLNQDEVSAGYEAWALLTTGADRWGARWPAYFASWGSGQNVLYSYLTIPFIALFGMTAAAVRAVQLIAGVATVLLAYPIGERARKGAGIWTMLIVAVCPWHVMLSRWGLESNLLPCMMTLGLVTTGLALKGRARSIVPALLPFGFALYAYGIVAVPMALLLLLLVVRHHRDMVRRWPAWCGAAALFAVVAVPFGLFVMKSYVVHHALPFEDLLPFSLPAQSATRLSEVADGLPILANLQFIEHGFDDHFIWNSLLSWTPLPAGLAVAATSELLLVLLTAVRTRSLREVTLIEIVLLSSAPLLVLLPFNVNQGNLLALGIVLEAGKAAGRISSAARVSGSEKSIAITGIVILVVPSLLAFASYVGPDYRQASKSGFHPGAEAALRRAAQLDPAATVFVTEKLSGGYVLTLWYLAIPPKQFRASHPTFAIPNFGQFVFRWGDRLAHPRYAFVVLSSDGAPCDSPFDEVESDGFRTGMCTTP